MKLLFHPYSLVPLFFSLFLYWRICKTEHQRLLLLTTVSLGLLAFIHPVFAVIVSSVILSTHFIFILRPGRTGWMLAFTLLASFVILTVGKYGKSIYLSLGISSDWVSQYLVVPLGISYFVFRWVHYVLDKYRGTLENTSFLRLSTYVLFFPTLPAGPLETFQGFHKKKSQSFDSDLFVFGVQRCLLGYFKKLFIVDLVFKVFFLDFTRGFIEGTVDLAAMSPWAPVGFIALMFFHAYLDLSAYTDIAIGLSALFGYRIMENFRWPFVKPNLAEFWRSWHISLSQWCRDNIYFPVFGMTRNSGLAILVCMLVMGLHPAWQNLLAQPIFKPVGYVVTFWYVALGYAFVAIPDFGDAWLVASACLSQLVFFI